MATYCKNHTDREAKRKCHYCRATICAECQEKLSHHIYCSKSCYYLEIMENSFDFIRASISRVFLLFARKRKIQWRNLLDAILLIGIAISIWIAYKSYKMAQSPVQIQYIHNLSNSNPSVDMFADYLDTLTVLTPLPNEIVVKNKFDIEGEAENNRIISLSSNGKLLHVQIVKEGVFAFKNITARPGQNRFIVRSMREDGSTNILEEIDFTFGQPAIRAMARDFVRGSRKEKQIALTFDGGYLNNATEDILDILQHEEIKATFFLTGIFMRKYPELVRRMAEDSHTIGNHTWTHPHMTSFALTGKHETIENISRELIHQELLRTSELFHMITNKKMSNLWRAPYGEHNQQIREWAAEAGFRHIGWTVGKNWEEGMDSMDWVADKASPAYHTADEIAEKILAFGNGRKQEANGAVILMHLGTDRTDDYPHLKLPMIIDEYKQRGYEFVTILEML